MDNFEVHRPRWTFHIIMWIIKTGIGQKCIKRVTITKLQPLYNTTSIFIYII